MALFVINFTNIFVEMGFTAAILNRQKATDKEYSSLFWFNLIISIILYLIIFFLSSVISNFYEESELKFIITVLGSNIILLSIGRVNRTILQKNFKFKKITIIDVIGSLFGLILSIILAINNYGIYSLIYGTLISSFISSSLFLFFRINKIYFQLYLYELKPFFKVGGYSLLSSILSFFSTDIDVLIIGKTLGPKALGFYSLSKQIVLKVFSVINPILTNVLTPVLSSFQDQKNKTKSIFLKTTSYLSLINLPIYLLIMVLSQEILVFIYGEEYVVAKLILSSLAVMYYINSINNPVGSLQIATGKTDIGFKWGVISLLISPFVIYLASLIDIETVAISRMILILVMLIPLWFVQLKPMVKITLQEYLNQFYRPVLFILLIFILNYFLDINLLYNMYFSIIVKSSIVLILFIFYIYKFNKKEAIVILNKINSQITQ